MEVSEKEIAEALSNNPASSGFIETFITTSLFWDCDCETKYINSFESCECQICGQIREDAPASRINEINASGILIDWYSPRIRDTLESFYCSGTS